MKIGLQVPRFHWPGGAPALADTLGRVAQAAEDGGFTTLWLMDHLFQIGSVGKVDEEMLEAYTTLGYIAGRTTRIRLGTLVTGVHYRYPGVLLKQVTTLDVLSGGRAWLGIGAGWNERESRGLGVPFPPLPQRFELLEDTLRAAHHLWRGDRQPFFGKRVQFNEPLNVPPPLSAPHPPIMVGGGGEHKTLRLVARYADACNLFARLPQAELRHKLQVLREHCAAENRPYAAIEKTTVTQWNVSRSSPAQLLDQLGTLRELGFDTVIVSLAGVEKISPIEVVARDVLPQAAHL